MDSLNEIKKVIKKSKSIALFTHISQDCDALGSTFGLALALKKLGKNVQIFLKEDFTDEQKPLFDENSISKERCEISDFDLFICCDLSSLNRLGDYSYIFDGKNKTICLDHHICQKFIGKYNYIDSESSSCCEIVYKLIKKLNVRIDSEIATKLYTGLDTDTSSFRNTNTNSNSLLTAYYLLEYGANIKKINQVLYQSYSLKDIDFQKYLYNNFKIKNDCAYITLTYNQLKSLNGNKEDCSSYSRNLVNIKGINYSFSLIENEPNEYKLSMRSKVGYDVREITASLGGGGHSCAAGATINAKNIDEALKIVLIKIEEIKTNNI